MRGVRFRQGDGWEGYCRACCEWWPVDLDYWPPVPKGGLCRACWRDLDRYRQAVRRQDPGVRARTAAYVRLYRDSRSPTEKAAEAVKRKAWRDAHREQIRENAKAYHAANRQKHIAYSRTYRLRKRAERELDRSKAA